MTQKKFTYPTSDKLKSKKRIGQLFAEGKAVKSFPLRLIYSPINEEENVHRNFGVSVSKRNFRKAVHRNRVKRLMRECYRLNQHLLETPTNKGYALMMIYQNNELPEFNALMKATQKLLQKFQIAVSENPIPS
jgi:ribonuclease P protein component